MKHFKFLFHCLFICVILSTPNGIGAINKLAQKKKEVQVIKVISNLGEEDTTTLWVLIYKHKRTATVFATRGECENIRLMSPYLNNWECIGIDKLTESQNILPFNMKHWI